MRVSESAAASYTTDPQRSDRVCNTEVRKPGGVLISSIAHTCVHRFRCESHCAAVVRLIRSSQIGSMDRMCPGAATSG